MTQLREVLEDEKDIDIPVESWRMEVEKERPYRTGNPVVWMETLQFNRPTFSEDPLQELIANSEELLKFRDDSDAGFVPYSKETLDRAIEFLSIYVKSAAGALGANIPIPRLLPGPSGSIDVHWKNEKKELIVNIPADKNAYASFYGDDYGKLYIKGSLDTASLHVSVLMWLLNS